MGYRNSPRFPSGANDALDLVLKKTRLVNILACFWFCFKWVAIGMEEAGHYTSQD